MKTPEEIRRRIQFLTELVSVYSPWMGSKTDYEEVDVVIATLKWVMGEGCELTAMESRSESP
jgi:hypothetical protein